MQPAMTRTLPRTLLTAALSLAGTMATFAIAAAPVPAEAAQRGAYEATLTSPLGEARREILDGTLWRCQQDRCAAPHDGGRALAMCGKVARKFGSVARFASPKGELASEDLAKCNAAA
jgi:hypothetical protein